MEEQTKLLVRNPNTIFYTLLELIRMLILLILTYYYLTSPYQTILKPFFLLTFWKTIIAAKLSETWIIKFINGFVEFDEKVMPLLSRLSVQQRSLSKIHRNMFFILSTIYFAGFKLLFLFLFPPRTLDVKFLAAFLIGPPFIIHYVVFISTYYFLYNFYIRFETLNDLWKCLPDGLIAVPDQWTHFEVVILIDDIRLLHSELSELLKIFSRGYGPLLITFFVSNYINILLYFYFAITFREFLPEYSFTVNFMRKCINYLGIGQSIVVMMIIMMLGSFINNNNIKMFMNQVSVYESDEITAFGLFKINLNLVMSILALIITGITDNHINTNERASNSFEFHFKLNDTESH
ncbi:Gustatory receptor, partial [Aphis craccivora]